MDCASYTLDRIIYFWLTKIVVIDEKKKLNFALSEDENVNVAELSTTKTLIAMCVFAKKYDDAAVSDFFLYAMHMRETLLTFYLDA
jgi:hypothetical protein